jgi:hypothetical protein
MRWAWRGEFELVHRLLLSQRRIAKGIILKLFAMLLGDSDRLCWRFVQSQRGDHADERQKKPDSRLPRNNGLAPCREMLGENVRERIAAEIGFDQPLRKLELFLYQAKAALCILLGYAGVPANSCRPDYVLEYLCGIGPIAARNKLAATGRSQSF